MQALRRTHGLSQVALGELIGYSGQHVSDIERARSCVALSCIAAIDAALDAQGALVALQPAVSAEREAARQRRAAARRGETVALSALRCVVSDAGDDDVEPTTRLGLLEAGAATALGAATVGPVPTRAAEVDPALVDHWTTLLALLGRLDAMYGPREVLAAVTREIGLIAEHRDAARGELRIDLMRVEARWCEFAAWLSNDAGQIRARTAWVDRAAHLAAEADLADIAALTRMRRSQWAEEHDTSTAVAHAQDALGVRHVSPQTLILCELRSATAHAVVGDAAASDRHLTAAYALDGDSAAPAGWGWGNRRTAVLIGATEARCWLALEPRKAVPVYETVLRDWPRDCGRSRGLHRARLALACAKIGERDRAEAEGRKALASAKATGSALAMRELRQLGAVLNAA
ncbi:MAG: helix-turn-helix domain-containing protein [Solirubrobacteraceae bacterium]